MSFFGKKWQKSGAENMVELMDAMKVEEKVRTLFNRPESVTIFTKNDDGSIQHSVEVEGKKVYDIKSLLNQDAEMKAPDGRAITYFGTLEGDVWKTTITTEDGKKVHMDRAFNGNTLTMTIQPEGIDIKGTITYKAI